MDKPEDRHPSSKLSEDLIGRGMDALLQGDFENSAWSLDSALYLTPDLTPRLWQRGLACFYAGRFEDGLEQLQADMQENGDDVEEVIWHFLCHCGLKGFVKAQEDGLLPLTGTPQVPPMVQVLNLYSGHGTVEDVFAAATSPGSSPVLSYNGASALAYAHFYVGMYYQLQGEVGKAENHLRMAAGMESPDYIGKLMGMHYRLFSETILRRSKVPSFFLGDQENGYLSSAIIQGGWQLSDGHLINSNPRSSAELVSALLRCYDTGIRTFDCGDIYTGVEELYGKVVAAHCSRGGRAEDIVIHTKLVPDLDAIRAGKVGGQYVRSVILRSLNRIGVESLNLVQFYLWDSSIPGWLEAARALVELQQEGLVRQIGITNFDLVHTKELVDAGIPVASTQVQFSLLDQRPLHSGLVEFCGKHGIAILAYGVLAGGFLSDRWLGVEPPTNNTLENRSLVKYLLIIEEFGGWPLYQELLQVLKSIATRHTPLKGEPVSVSMVAIQYILCQEQVEAVIIGSHDSNHLESTVLSTKLKLTERDLTEIQSVLTKAKGPCGEVFGLERKQEAHSKIMRYNLNQVNQGAHLEELAVRFLSLHFCAYPEEATRTGYRNPPTKDYQVFCRKLCTGTQTKPLYLSQRELSAARACNFDHLLGPGSLDDIAKHCRRVRSLLVEVDGIDEASLSPQQAVDLHIIASQLNLELVKWNHLQTHKRNPGFYLPINAVLYLLPVWGPDESVCSADAGTRSLQECTHPGAVDMSVEERLVALLSRLRAIPRLVQCGEQNLTSAVEIFTSTALEVCTSFRSFVAKDVSLLCEKLISLDPSTTDPSVYEVILKDIAFSSTVAAASLDRYESFLRQALSRATPACGIGKEVYESVLRYSHFFDNSTDLLRLGEEHFSKVQHQLEELAKEIDPTKSWQEIAKDVIETMRPTAPGLLAAYMSEIERARRHMLEHDLVPPLPESEQVWGFYTPKFLVPFSPFGDFLNPSAFAGMGAAGRERPTHTIGHLMLHSIEAMELSRVEREKLLRAHTYPWISVIAPHETYPGHHVQALLAQEHPRILRKFYESTLFYEGWGLYTEQLAYETGFFDKDQLYVTDEGEERIVPAAQFSKLARLTQLRLQLWRAARIILDVKLNTGELTFQECQEFLQKEVMFNPVASKGEVYMYVSRPGYATCYVAGYTMLMRLRERMRQHCSEHNQEFSLKGFHTTLLSNGCIPFRLLEKLLCDEQSINYNLP